MVYCFLQQILMLGGAQLNESWFRNEITEALHNIDIEWTQSNNLDNQSGILSITLSTPSGFVILD
jgi:hypothetical protein